jgi:hypothetical protein
MILNSSKGIDRKKANHRAVGQLFTKSPATIDRWFDSAVTTGFANSRYHNTFAGTSKPTARRQSPRRPSSTGRPGHVAATTDRGSNRQRSLQGSA